MVSLVNAPIPAIWSQAEEQSFREFMKAHLPVSLMDFIPVAQRAAIRAYTSTFDCSPAMAEAMEAFPTTLNSNRGGFIFCPAGLYNFSLTINCKRRVVIMGEGGGYYDDGAPVTKFVFAANKSGFIVHTSTTIESGLESPGTTSGAGSRIENVYLQGSGASGKGIWFRAPGVAMNCTVDGFGVGIYPAAQVNTADALLRGNCNGFHVWNCTAVNCVSHGMHITGHDANAGATYGFRAINNGGWGLLDNCFLGNTHAAPYFENNTLGPFSLTDGNARGIVIGPISEDAEASTLTSRQMSIGGYLAGGVTGAGMGGNNATDPAIGDWAIDNGMLWNASTIAGGLIFQRGTTPNRQAIALMKGNDCALAFNFEGDTGSGYRFAYDTSAKTWVRKHGATTMEHATTSLSSGGTTNPKDEGAVAIPAANLVYPRSVWLPSLHDAGEYRLQRYESGNQAAASYNTAGGQTYSAADVLKGGIVRDCAGASRTDTLPTAALLVAAIANTPAVGQIIWFTLTNGSDGDETITLNAGTGGSFDANQTAASRVVPWKTQRRIRIRLTNVTSGLETYQVVM